MKSIMAKVSIIILSLLAITFTFAEDRLVLVLGTTSSTALAGDTTTITTAQAAALKCIGDLPQVTLFGDKGAGGTAGGANISSVVPVLNSIIGCAAAL